MPVSICHGPKKIKKNSLQCTRFQNIQFDAIYSLAIVPMHRPRPGSIVNERTKSKRFRRVEIWRWNNAQLKQEREKIDNYKRNIASSLCLHFFDIIPQVAGIRVTFRHLPKKITFDLANSMLQKCVAKMWWLMYRVSKDIRALDREAALTMDAVDKNGRCMKNCAYHVFEPIREHSISIFFSLSHIQHIKHCES